MMINFNSNKYKNTTQLVNFLVITGLGCTFYFLWGIYTLYIDNLVYDKSFPEDDFIIATILGFAQALLLQMIVNLMAFSSICCLQPLYRVFIQKKDKFNSCHLSLILLLLFHYF